MSKSITLQSPTYEECRDLILSEGDHHTYTVSVDGEIITLTGNVMRVFLIPTDSPDWFMRF